MSINAKIITCFGALAAATLACFGSYRPLGTSTEPNTWTYKIEEVIAKAATTGYPILYIDVNSVTCSHCHQLYDLTLSSSEFKTLEGDVVFYLVMTDDAQISTMSSAATYARYKQYYYGNGGYPLVAVLAKDGSVYGSFDRTVTDVRNIAADLRKLIEELSVKQIGKVLHTDGSVTSEDASVTPSTSSDTASSASAPVDLGGWVSLLKGKSNGVVFDTAENLVGTIAFNCTAKGQANVKVTTINGKSNVKAYVTLDSEGNPLLSADGIQMKYDSGSALWIGTFGEGKAFASKNGARQYDGLYTLAANSGNASAGYLTIAAKNGKGKTTGMLNGRNKISVNGVGIVLPAEVVAKNIPKWNVGAGIALYPVVNANKQIYGAVVVSGGEAAGKVRAFGEDWAASGERWDSSTSLAPLNGLTLKVGAYEIPVVAESASKISAGANGYSAKVQAQVRKGAFKGSLKLPEGNLRFEGALMGSGEKLRGAGVSFGAGVYVVALGNVDDCGECTVKDK